MRIPLIVLLSVYVFGNMLSAAIGFGAPQVPIILKVAPAIAGLGAIISIVQLILHRRKAFLPYTIGFALLVLARLSAFGLNPPSAAGYFGFFLSTVFLFPSIRDPTRDKLATKSLGHKFERATKIVFGVLLYILIVFIALFGISTSLTATSSEPASLNLYQGAMLVFLVVGAPIWVMWKVFRRIKGSISVVIPTGPHVLLLRPFQTDAALRNESIRILFRAFTLGPLRPGKTFEVSLKSSLKQLGSLVAIGAPSDFLTPDGADRIYVNDASWQPTITNLLRTARTVVIISGTTQGVVWEKEHIRQIVDPRRVLLVLPVSTQQRREEMLLLSAKHLQTSIPLPPTSQSKSERPLFYVFDSFWNALLLQRVDTRATGGFFSFEFLPQTVDFDKTLAPFISTMTHFSSIVSSPPPLPPPLPGN